MTQKTIFGEHDENTLAQLDRCLAAGSAAAGVLCADGHLGYAHPIGGVVGYTDHISISGVGYDIACGNMAVRLDTPYASVKDRIGPILQDVAKAVSFGIGRRNSERVDHALFESGLWEEAGVTHLKAMAREQLGTVGSGTTTSTCSRTRPASCGSACTSVRAGLATRPPQSTWSWPALRTAWRLPLP